MAWYDRINATTQGSYTPPTTDGSWASRINASVSQVQPQPSIPSKPLTFQTAGNIGIGTNAPQPSVFQASQQNISNIANNLWNDFLIKSPIGAVIQGKPQEFLPRVKQTLKKQTENPEDLAMNFSPAGATTKLSQAIAKEVKPKVIENLFKSVFPDVAENLFKPFAQKLAPITDTKVVQKELDNFIATKLPVGKEIKIKPFQPLVEKARKENFFWDFFYHSGVRDELKTYREISVPDMIRKAEKKFGKQTYDPQIVASYKRAILKGQDIRDITIGKSGLVEDGFHRLRALNELGIKKWKAFIGSSIEEKAIRRFYNQSRLTQATGGLEGGGVSGQTKKIQLPSYQAGKETAKSEVLPQAVKTAESQQPVSPSLTKTPTSVSSENIIPPVKNPQAVKALEEDQFIKGLEENRPPEIKVDDATMKRAEAVSGMSEGSVNKLDDSTRQAFQEWVNTQKATRIEGLIKGKEFKDLDTKGVKGIFEFQSGINDPRYTEVKKYFDDKYKVLQDAGVEFGYKKDYLPQIWANTTEEVQKVFGKALGLRPSFTLQSIIEDYKAGIDAGLKPKFQNISQLVGWYEQKANKVLGDSKFFNYLREDGLIVPSSKAPLGWKTLDADRFPKVKVAYENKVFQGPFAAPEELAGIINNYLKEPNAKIAMVANFVSSVKNRLLSFGIPGTAINFHSFNILARHTLFGTGGNPITRLLTGAKYMIYPTGAERELNKVLSTAPQAIRKGLTMSTEDYLGLTSEAEKFVTKFGKKWNEVFEKPLFEKMLPALKLSSYNNLTKNGMIGEDAAKLVNNVYGGINWEQMGRSKEIQNLFRIFVLTPDWLESTGRLGGNLVKAFTPGQFKGSPVAARYRTMTATLLGSYVALNAANKMTSGHYAYENDPGHAFELELGETPDGQKRYWRPYGTALDFVRLSVDITIGMLKGDYSVLARTIRNRLSPPVGFGVGMLTDTDYRGQPIGWKGTDRYGKEMPLTQRLGGIAGEISQGLGFPSFAKQGIDTATGKQGLEQGILGALELPVRYSGGYFSKTGKIYNEIRQKKTAKEREDLWNKMVSEGKITKNNVDEVTQYFKDEQLGTTDAERKWRNLGVEDRSRARAVTKEVVKLKTNKERVDYVNSLIEKKVVTEKVLEQVTELINK